jgi:hypothetical protein
MVKATTKETRKAKQKEKKEKWTNKAIDCLVVEEWVTKCAIERHEKVALL